MSGTNDGVGATARFNSPFGIAVDGSGSIYVSDSGSHTIRKISAFGSVTTFAGVAGVLGSTDGTGAAARFHSPRGLALDDGNNLYVADSENDTIRKISPAGVVTTFAGSAGRPGSANKTGAAASFNFPTGVALDANGNIYVADNGNNIIRKITPAAAVSTLAGSAGISGAKDGTGTDALFSSPFGLTVDGNANVFVTDTSNHTVRKITPDGAVTTLVGLAGKSGSTDEEGASARFNFPIGVAVDENTNLFVADFANDTVRKVTAALAVTTVAGLPGGSGGTDGMGTAARFNFPSAIIIASNGSAYIADLGNDTIRQMTSEGAVTTFAGLAGESGANDGVGSSARFSEPASVALDRNGNVVVADSLNHTIREISPLGNVTTLAGSAGTSGTDDGTGAAARFNQPFGVAVDTNGNIFVADTHNNALRKIAPDGTVTTFAGTKGIVVGTNDGSGLSATFDIPEGETFDSNNNLYVVDDGGFVVRKVAPDASVTTFAGIPTHKGSADGIGSAATFNFPFGIASDSNDNLFVADTGNNTIRKITPSGVVTTIGGLPGQSGSLDGTGGDARFNEPEGVAVDGQGNVYVADSANHSIRKGFRSLPDEPIVDLAAAQVGVTRHFSISNLTTTSWSWRLIRRPAASSAQLVGANTASPTFTPDVEDVYIVRFQGWDNAGRTTIRTLTLYADNTAPSLSMTNPIPGQISSNSVFTVSGTASDNLGLSNVWVQLNGGAWTNAAGTVAWSVNLALAPGTNVIRAYAQDLAGNVSSTNEVDLFHVPSAPLTVQINGGGTVAPDLNGVLLAIGNTYSMTAQPGPGSVFVNWTGDITSDSPTLTFVMQSNLTFIANFTDPVRPTVAITFPKNRGSVSNALFTATGTAADNGQLASVWYQLNGGGWIQATNTSNWTAGLAPSPGANTLLAYAMDTFTNISATNSVSFTYVPSGQMRVMTIGRGTLVPNYDGALLAVGKSFKMMAKPDLGYIFTGWADNSGNTLTTDSTLTFLVQTNTTLRASFILNPFATLVGSFAGLFYETNNVTVTNSGFVSLSLGGFGGFSAKLSLAAGKTISLSGQFSSDGVFSNSIATKGSTPFVVQLQLDAANSRIVGSVGNSGWTAPLVAIKAFFSTPNPAPEANKNYTLVFPGGDDSSVQPAGNGYGTVNVTASGNISFSGVLGDGVKVSQKTFISKQNQWPFYAAPYKGQGVVLGWLAFTTNDSNSDLGGLINWVKQPQSTGKSLYPGGFNFPVGLQAVGSLYSFTNGMPLLNLPAGGSIVLQQGNLPQSFTNNFTLGADNKVTSADGLNLTITTKSGIFKGTAHDPASGGSVPINGVLLQKQNSAFGTFLGGGQSGAVYLGP
ncbi:MAG TPA: Ig-like domain-containing protein [Verrucomicrobiae bacterium]|nr:Ig-like domain-containing protein [Verrucomicrobiae bacterium]